MGVQTDMTGKLEAKEVDFTTTDATEVTTFASPRADYDEVSKLTVVSTTIPENDSVGKIQEDVSIVEKPLQQPNEVCFRNDIKVAFRVTTAAISGLLLIQRRIRLLICHRDVYT